MNKDNFLRSIVGVEFNDKGQCVAIKGSLKAKDLKRGD